MSSLRSAQHHIHIAHDPVAPGHVDNEVVVVAGDERCLNTDSSSLRLFFHLLSGLRASKEKIEEPGKRRNLCYSAHATGGTTVNRILQGTVNHKTAAD